MLVELTTAKLCLAAAIYFEARDQKLIGQMIVANTVLNRVESPRYPNTICGVVKQKHQFSFYWDGKTEYVGERDAWDYSMSVAEHMLERRPSYFSGCHYHTTKVNPKWNRALVKTFTVQDHIFYEGGC